MSKINDGGPAFPQSKDNALYPVMNLRGEDVSSGMSMRDWFAGQALSGLCANAIHAKAGSHELAAAAYLVADAMLRARDEALKEVGS